MNTGIITSIVILYLCFTMIIKYCKNRSKLYKTSVKRYSNNHKSNKQNRFNTSASRSDMSRNEESKIIEPHSNFFSKTKNK